jgi:hypothetical protein
VVEENCSKAMAHVVKFRGYIYLQIHSCRELGDLSVYLRKIKFQYVEWIKLAQDGVQRLALVSTATNIRIP